MTHDDQSLAQQSLGRTEQAQERVRDRMESWFKSDEAKSLGITPNPDGTIPFWDAPLKYPPRGPAPKFELQLDQLSDVERKQFDFAMKRRERMVEEMRQEQNVFMKAAGGSGAGGVGSPELVEPIVGRHAAKPVEALPTADGTVRAEMDTNAGLDRPDRQVKVVDATDDLSFDAKGTVVSDGGSTRTVTIEGREYKLERDAGDVWYYGKRPSSDQTAPIKITIEARDSQELGRLQQVMIPALENDPSLAMVDGWKTMDPRFATGETGAYGI